MNDELNQTPTAPVADDNSDQGQAQAPQTDTSEAPEEAPASDEGDDSANPGSDA